jgi:endonuclease/exonuclease/phosphatase family metal-dependent hydrolase
MSTGAVTVHALEVLTQNAWGGAPLWKRRREHLARAIGELGPDVVGLQEIHASAPADAASQAHELAELAGYDATFAPARVTASGHCEGVALLVRRGAVIGDRTVLELSRDAEDALDGPHPRVALKARLRFPDRADAELTAIVTHLSLSKSARARTIVELVAFADAARREGESAVVMGDFNATPDEPALGAFAAGGWVDAWRQHHEAARGGTWPAGAPFRRIDYVFARPGTGLRVASSTRTPVSGSDHVGLLVRLAKGSS